jgi:hypothetical protein
MIHVVAADEQVVADRDSPQHQLAALFSYADERQIGRPAAHVTNQERVADFEHPPPTLTHRGEPGVDGCLRFFEQHQAGGQTGGESRFASELSRGGVE